MSERLLSTLMLPRSTFVRGTTGGLEVSADLRNVVRFALFICWKGEGDQNGNKPSRVSCAYKC
jgi:hypothetical protein